MMLVAALILAQSCEFSSTACYDVVAANVAQADIMEPASSSGGPVFRSKRSVSDQSADFSFRQKPSAVRDPDTFALEVRDGENRVVMRLRSTGEMQAGTQWSEAAFNDMSSFDGHPTLICTPSGEAEVGGCYLILRADMAPGNAHAFHGALTVANKRHRDGGLLLQFQGAGKSNAKSAVYPGTTTAIDEFGNLILRDGWVYQSLRTADRGPCYTSAVWDGEWHQPGGYGYDVDEDALVFRSAAACAADGGVEHVITDRSLEARLALIEARLAALEASCP